MLRPIVECVPNISEGRDAILIGEVVGELARVDGITILRVESNPDANRSVITFAGSPEGVVEGALTLYRICRQRIDMRNHLGVHPRIGAVDVCPLIPMQGITMTECNSLAHQLGERVAAELDLPVYLYEYSASTPQRRDLAAIRRGQYEGLADKLIDPNWRPDFGSAKFIPEFGATVIGARRVLVAFNLLLDSEDWELASSIARELRNLRMESLPGVKAIGWMMPCFGCAQVSTNITDPRRVSFLDVWDEVGSLAKKFGTRVVGSELVGLVPEDYLFRAGIEAIERKGKLEATDHEDVLSAAIDFLGFDYLSGFDLEERVLERRLRVVPGWASQTIDLSGGVSSDAGGR